MSINLSGSGALVSKRGLRDLWPIPARVRDSVRAETNVAASAEFNAHGWVVHGHNLRESLEGGRVFDR